MLLFAPYLMFFFFSGNVANFPTVLQPSSTCQWFRLLTVSCQRFTNQPIVFCVVRPTLNSLALAKRAVSLFSSRAAALVSRVSRLRRSRARALLSLNLKKKRDCWQSSFTQIYRDLYGDAMLVPTWMGTNMADGNQQKHLLPSFGTKT